MSANARKVLLFAVLVALTLAVFPAVLMANHSWNGYHWARSNNPFTVTLGDNVTSAWDSYLNGSASDWNASSVLNTTIAPGRTNRRNCRPSSGTVQVCNSTYGNTGWLGVAQIWITGGSHITQGTVKLNDTYFNTQQYNTPPWRNLVSCQEVGHTLGLDHQDVNFNNPNLGTCMDYTSNPLGPPDNEHPNQHDYDQLVTIYSHLDGANVALQAARRMPSAMTDVDYSEPRQWGRTIQGSRAAGYSVYDLDFGHGNHIFTFVTWAK